MIQTRSKEARIALVIFLAAADLMLALHGNRVVATNDEGILLEPAQRVAMGAHPYVDFWAYMSPGSYWLQAAVFQWFGFTLFAGRMIVIFDFALQCAVVYWLTSRLSRSRIAGAGVLAAFVGFQIADPSFLTAQHRWDSATLALAAVCICLTSLRWRWAIAGALFAAAAWCTPSVALAGIVAMIWIWMTPERRGGLIPFLGGVALVSAAAVGLLAREGALSPFLDQMLWLKRNYAALNAMPYGSIIGGYGPLFEGASGWREMLVRGLLVGCVALPAILPVVAVIAWGIALKRGKVNQWERPEVVLVLMTLVALELSTLPRSDVMHLEFVVAAAYILAGAAFARFVPGRWAVTTGTVILMLAGAFALNFANGRRATRVMTSPVGDIRVSNDQAATLAALFANVKPGQGLFVYPYMPIEYFLTQGKNPTRYSYLGPGMATAEDEKSALADLKAHPPEWLLYMKLSRAEFLRVFPHAHNLDWRFETLESWLDANYQPMHDPDVRMFGYELWRRTPVQRDSILQSSR